MERANSTEVQLVFQSSTVEVLKEEQAYSIESFVADMGGVLGLFVGFNFLMFWDFIILLKTKWKTLKVFY